MRDIRDFSYSRQLVVVGKLSDIVRKHEGKKHMSIGKLMREAGYSQSFADHPARLFESKNFQSLLDEYLPDINIVESHAGILEAERISRVSFPKNEKDEVIKEIIESCHGCKLTRISKSKKSKIAYYASPDSASRLGAVKQAYMIKGLYPTTKVEQTATFRFSNLTDEQLDRAIERIEQSV